MYKGGGFVILRVVFVFCSFVVVWFLGFGLGVFCWVGFGGFFGLGVDWCLPVLGFFLVLPAWFWIIVFWVGGVCQWGLGVCFVFWVGVFRSYYFDRGFHAACLGWGFGGCGDVGGCWSSNVAGN